MNKETKTIFFPGLDEAEDRKRHPHAYAVHDHCMNHLASQSGYNNRLISWKILVILLAAIITILITNSK